jgi:hypothetical protein
MGKSIKETDRTYTERGGLSRKDLVPLVLEHVSLGSRLGVVEVGGAAWIAFWVERRRES